MNTEKKCRIELSVDTWQEIIYLVGYGLELIEDRFTLALTEKQAAELLESAFREAINLSDAKTPTFPTTSDAP